MRNPRVAVIGARPAKYGERPSIGYREAEKFHNAGANIVAVVRSTEEAAFYAAQQIHADIQTQEQPTPYAYSELERMLDTERPNIVVVATPMESHYGIIKRVWQYHNPIDIFAEKPLCWNLNETAECNLAKAEELIRSSGSRRLHVNTQLVSVLDKYVALNSVEEILKQGSDNPEFRFTLVTQGNNENRTNAYIAADLLPHALSFLVRFDQNGVIEDSTLKKDYKEYYVIVDFLYRTKSYGIIRVHIELGNREAPKFEFGFKERVVTRHSVKEIDGKSPPPECDIEYYMIDEEREIKIPITNTLKSAVTQFLAGQPLVPKRQSLANIRLQSQIMA